MYGVLLHDREVLLATVWTVLFFIHVCLSNMQDDIHCHIPFAVPSVIVKSSSALVRILDMSPYNQFTVTCNATAEVEEETVPLEMTVDWIRRSEPQFAPGMMNTSIPSTEYMTTGSPEDGYQSILTTTETDTENRISYRCRARLVVDSSIQGANDTTLDVVGKNLTRHDVYFQQSLVILC